MKTTLADWQRAATRALARVAQPEVGCWEWPKDGARNGAPRSGQMRPCVRVGGRAGQTITVARVVLGAQLGRVLTKDEIAGHKCDNGQCIRPDHLAVLSQGENLQEAWDRERRTYAGCAIPSCTACGGNGEDGDENCRRCGGSGDEPQQAGAA